MLTYLDGFAGLQAVIHGRLVHDRRRAPQPGPETRGDGRRYLTILPRPKETRP